MDEIQALFCVVAIVGGAIAGLTGFFFRGPSLVAAAKESKGVLKGAALGAAIAVPGFFIAVSLMFLSTWFAPVVLVATGLAQYYGALTMRLVGIEMFKHIRSDK